MEYAINTYCNFYLLGTGIKQEVFFIKNSKKLTKYWYLVSKYLDWV